MSTNPYAAPRAQVADETIVSGNFVPDGRGVPTGDGWDWISSAWSIFRARAGLWIAMVLVFGVILLALAVIPFVGQLALALLWPVFIAGFAMASRTIDEGREARFSELFSGFSHRFGALLGVGALSLVVSIVLMFVVFAVAGISMASVMGPAATPDGLLAMGTTLLLAFLIMTALMLPLFMATWFAAPLIAFHELGPVEAMKASFKGCLKNMLPFLLYGIVLLVASAVASIPFLLGWLVLAPVIAASVYTSYRDIYFSPAA
jgi:uncharacterized membrane protein